MANKYERPNYEKLYPGLDIPKEIMQALLDSDYKMEYMEHDLKTGQLRKDNVRKKEGYTPSREVSYNQLLETDWQFSSADSQPEDAWLAKEEVQELRLCIQMLSDNEQNLVYALYFKGLTEREYAKQIGKSKTAVHKQKTRILAKIKKNLQTG